MNLTQKQIDFAKVMVENIMIGIIPVIKQYIDGQVTKTKNEIISEIKLDGKFDIQKLNETKTTLKEHSFNLAKDLFSDEDFGTAYDNLKNVSPKNPMMKETTTNPTISDVNIDNLEIDYTKEISMDSVLNMAEKVNENIITGEYKSPSIKLLNNLQKQDFSRFLD